MEQFQNLLLEFGYKLRSNYKNRIFIYEKMRVLKGQSFRMQITVTRNNKDMMVKSSVCHSNDFSYYRRKDLSYNNFNNYISAESHRLENIVNDI